MKLEQNGRALSEPFEIELATLDVGEFSDVYVLISSEISSVQAPSRSRIALANWIVCLRLLCTWKILVLFHLDHMPLYKISSEVPCQKSLGLPELRTV
jgi:hypothetical protein